MSYRGHAMRSGLAPPTRSAGGARCPLERSTADGRFLRSSGGLPGPSGTPPGRDSAPGPRGAGAGSALGEPIEENWRCFLPSRATSRSSRGRGGGPRPHRGEERSSLISGCGPARQRSRPASAGHRRARPGIAEHRTHRRNHGAAGRLAARPTQRQNIAVLFAMYPRQLKVPRVQKGSLRGSSAEQRGREGWGGLTHRGYVEVTPQRTERERVCGFKSRQKLI